MPDKEQDFPCLKCDYNLRGLEDDGHCPECGLELMRSLNGNIFFYSSREHLKTVRSGVNLIFKGFMWHIIVFAGWFVLTLAMTMISTPRIVPPPLRGMGMGPGFVFFDKVDDLIHAAISLIILVGWWKLTARDPSIIGTGTGWKMRLAVRISATVSVLMMVVGQLQYFIFMLISRLSWNFYTIGAGLIGVVVVAWLVMFFSSMLYLRWLARRMPKNGILMDTTTIMWSVPSLVILTLVLMITSIGTLAIVPTVALLIPTGIFLLMLKDIRSILSDLLAEKANT